MPGKTAKDVSDLSGARLVLLEQGSALKVFPVPPCRITLGRDPACTISLMDPRASKSHATLTRRGRHAVLEDLDSMNGTRVNECRVKAHGLYPGDVVRIGQCSLLFLTDGMPATRSGGSARGWIIGRRAGGVGIKLPVARRPILFGSAPESEFRGAPERVAPYHAVIAAMADGVLLIELGSDPPRCTRLTERTRMRFDDAVLSYQPGSAKAAPEVEPMIAEPPPELAPMAAPVPEPTLRRHAQHAKKKAPSAPKIEAGRRDADASVIAALHREADRVDKIAVTPKLAATQNMPAVPAAPHVRQPMLHPAFVLRARSGPLNGSEFGFNVKPILIGSAPDCDIRLDDPAVDPRQARIRRQEGTIIVEDLGRADTVFVNDKQILRAPIKPGDILRVGASEFLVHL